ncbi:MAG TPA: hypothetical protein VFI27_02805 [candidate division Zixibacteria bacterium]|nr:hypothetical protein [candidate division Zixibacteria bacterium]
MNSAPRDKHSGIAIACSVGGFKSVFLHGVLAAFEEGGFRAEAYAAASSSVLPAAFAAVGKTRELGLKHWIDGLQIIEERGRGMSDLVLAGIEKAAPVVSNLLFKDQSPRFLIAASAVDPEGQEETQGKGARRLGRLLLLAAARGDRSWIDEHLILQLFDSRSTGESLLLTADNLREVAYASSRMLHAWDIPAWIGGRPYVDAFYRCACPALEVAELGFTMVIAISNEPVLYKDIFQSEVIQPIYDGVPIEIIGPDIDPAEMGVSYTTATADSLAEVFRHGNEKGRTYLERTFQNGPTPG